MKKDSIRILAELETMLAIKNAQLLANPRPALDAAHREVCRAIRCFQDIEEILSPNLVFDAAEDFGIAPQDFRGGDRIMIQKIRARISRYMDGD